MSVYDDSTKVFVTPVLALLTSVRCYYCGPWTSPSQPEPHQRPAFCQTGHFDNNTLLRNQTRYKWQDIYNSQINNITKLYVYKCVVNILFSLVCYIEWIIFWFWQLLLPNPTQLTVCEREGPGRLGSRAEHSVEYTTQIHYLMLLQGQWLHSEGTPGHSLFLSRVPIPGTNVIVRRVSVNSGNGDNIKTNQCLKIKSDDV